ncbi:MAG: substrate-binding domain-containing protein [Nitrospira sp.]|jgi:molybdate transport system substrate-binding protein|nr:substrate-binding domain-containing protein [Nitrospira sp.]
MTMRWMSVVTVGLCIAASVNCGPVPRSVRDEGAVRVLVIATSPAVAEALTQLGQAFEVSHPGVRVQLSVDPALDLRRMVAAMESRGKSFIGSGPIHLVAPGGDEVITRMEQKYYLLPEANALYATERLVLIAPESLSEAPESFEALATMGTVRIAVADLSTRLGVETDQVLRALGLKGKRLDLANDQAGILDHVLSGQADVGILFGQDAMKVQQRVRIVATAPAGLYKPIPHSIAMERYCPDRPLCEEFLRFVTSPDGQSVLKRLGYGPGKTPESPVRVSIP